MSLRLMGSWRVSLPILFHCVCGLTLDPWTSSLLGLPTLTTTRSPYAAVPSPAPAAQKSHGNLLSEQAHLPQYDALARPEQVGHAEYISHEAAGTTTHATPAVSSPHVAPLCSFGGTDTVAFPEEQVDPGVVSVAEASVLNVDASAAEAISGVAHAAATARSVFYERDPANDLACCSAGLETRPELGALPRFYVLARPSAITEDQVQIVLDSLRRALDRDAPFTVVWDLRQLQIPSRAVIRIATDWMALPDNAQPLDRLVQATAVVVKGPLIRAVAKWTLAICNPPAPVRICGDENEALEFASSFGE